MFAVVASGVQEYRKAIQSIHEKHHENFTNSRYFSRFFLKVFDGKIVRIFATFFMMLFVTLLNRLPVSLSVSVKTSSMKGGVQSHTGMLSKPPAPARVGKLLRITRKSEKMHMI